LAPSPEEDEERPVVEMGVTRDRRPLPVIARETLQDLILGGRFEVGSQLPSEEELSVLLGVSRPTLREAIRAMEDDGQLQRRRGIGTFVLRAAVLENRLDVNSGVTQLIEQAGMKPGSSALITEQRPATAEEAARLQLEPGEPVLALDRVRTADGRPAVFSRDVLAVGILHPARVADDGSIYTTLQQQGKTVHHGLAELDAVAATAALARHLNVARGAPLLLLRQLDFTADDQPVLLSHEWVIPGAFRMTIPRRGPGV
jgi:DNA-binding GntR family transcriptional regulator